MELLLAAGARHDVRDALGSTPMLEAVKGGQDQCMAVLLRHKAKLGLDRNEMAALLCTCTADSDAPKLRWDGGLLCTCTAVHLYCCVPVLLCTCTAVYLYC